MEIREHFVHPCLARRGIMQSMHRPRKLNDNVHIESLFHSMKSDIVHGVRFDHDHEITSVGQLHALLQQPATACIAAIGAASDV
jgi:transposase InsO family protein